MAGKRSLIALMLLTCGTLLPAQDEEYGEEPAAELQPKPSPLLRDPEGIDELFEAILLMDKLGRGDVAKRYLDELLAAEPDDESLLRLRDKHGPWTFLQLARTINLRPASAELLRSMNAAFRENGATGKRLDTLIAQLSGGPETRESALISLRDAGAAVVPRMLQVLNDASQQALHDGIAQALPRMSRQAAAPLEAALDSPNLTLRATAIDALGRIGADSSLPRLIFHAWNPEAPEALNRTGALAVKRLDPAGLSLRGAEAGAVELMRLARQNYAGKVEWNVNTDGSVDLWTWDEETGTVLDTPVTVDMASLYTATRLAKQATQLQPDDEEAQSLYASAALAYEAENAGWDESLDQPDTNFSRIMTLGPEVAEDALEEALRAGSPAGCRAALSILKRLGQSSPATNLADTRSPVRRALGHSDPRVQLEAAEAMLDLDHDGSVAGTAQLVDVLARALDDQGDASCVVMDVNEQRGQTVAAFLEENGFHSILTPNGRRGFRAASARNDIEVVCVNAVIADWPLSQTLSTLRGDTRTAHVPIVIYGPESIASRLKPTLRRYDNMWFVNEIATGEYLARQLDPVIRVIRRSRIAPALRKRNRKRAAAALARLADRGTVGDLKYAEDALFEAARDDELSAACLQTLAAIPTATAQLSLADVTTNQTRPNSIRVNAANELARHIGRFGRLLPSRRTAAFEQIRRKSKDAELVSAVSAVLGALQPDRSKRRARLRGIEVEGPQGTGIYTDE